MSAGHIPRYRFLRASRGEFDAVVACYHDQAMIPVKCLSFGEAVTSLLDCPLYAPLRSRTAFDIAGKGLGSIQAWCGNRSGRRVVCARRGISRAVEV